MLLTWIKIYAYKCLWHHWHVLLVKHSIFEEQYPFVSFLCIIVAYAGWGPHAYFQMLAESRNGARPSSLNSDSQRAQSAELQAVSLYIPPQHEGDTRSNSWDSSPMLGAPQNVRTH